VEVCITASPLRGDDQGGSRVMADCPKFMPALYNLQSNAVKLTNVGVRAGVDVTQDKPGQLALGVSDTGIDTVAQAVDKLLQNFYQPDNSNLRRHEGMGPGLALTRKIVELRHGMNTVESAPGEGSLPTVILPHAAATYY
jgi:signal transduction histidine kinase